VVLVVVDITAARHPQLFADAFDGGGAPISFNPGFHCCSLVTSLPPLMSLS